MKTKYLLKTEIKVTDLLTSRFITIEKGDDNELWLKDKYHNIGNLITNSENTICRIDFYEGSFEEIILHVLVQEFEVQILKYSDWWNAINNGMHQDLDDYSEFSISMNKEFESSTRKFKRKLSNTDFTALSKDYLNKSTRLCSDVIDDLYGICYPTQLESKLLNELRHCKLSPSKDNLFGPTEITLEEVSDSYFDDCPF